ncbi:uncharacterized protein LOC141809364 [Halichoeres trimaculatus]|uniref:uncharacterized protein LOC141809364 n=1 Tax=Halichoeres trimaculatus TaxID=147232 RepID=UPI003D9EAED2
MTQTPNSGSATFKIMKVDFDHEGSYQCQYEKRSSSQTFRSPLSNPARLSLTVPLQQPSISLTSPNEGLIWSPEGAEVTRGYSFTFLCSINCSFPDGQFFLISSDADTAVIKSAVNHSASFIFPVAEYKHQGNYSCVYEVELSGRRFNSTGTAPTRIVIKSSLLLLVSSVAAGIVIMLVVVLLVVLVQCRRKKQAKQPGTLDQTQLNERLRNCYDKEEDEEKYVNVTSLVSKKPRDQRGDGKEDDVYEEPEIFADFCLNSKMSKVKEMHFREDDQNEEETSDEDDDYENVTMSVTGATVDIYGDQEDIYQNL